MKALEPSTTFLQILNSVIKRSVYFKIIISKKVKMKICNVILASDESNGIGLSKCDRAVTLPWSLDNEFGYV